MAALLMVCVYWARSALKKLFPHSRNTFLVERSPYKVPLPSLKHRTLTEEEIGGRELVVIGDIHGCYDELVLLLQQCSGHDPNTLVLCVGDLLNKGPDSLQVLRLIREIGALTVRGNHDEVCLREWQNCQDSAAPLPKEFKWMSNLTSKELNWLSELPYTISIPSRNIVLVHAGLVPGVPLQEQDPNDLLHMRDLLYTEDTQKWKALKFVTTTSKPWASVWPGPSHVYFGHDARRFFQSYEFATGLDTGCVYGGKLTAVYPCDDGRLVEVEAIGVPRDRPPITK